jgi:hypothetical protein
MPQDKNGNPLAVGDKVLIRATIRSMVHADVRANISVDTDEELAPDFKVGIVLNGKQVELAVEAPKPPRPEPTQLEVPEEPAVK